MRKTYERPKLCALVLDILREGPPCEGGVQVGARPLHLFAAPVPDLRHDASRSARCSSFLSRPPGPPPFQNTLMVQKKMSFGNVSFPNRQKRQPKQKRLRPSEGGCDGENVAESAEADEGSATRQFWDRAGDDGELSADLDRPAREGAHGEAFEFESGPG